MATSSTNPWVITNEHGAYWAGGDNWYPDLVMAELYDDKPLAKNFYRDTHGKFPRNIDAVQLTDEQWHDTLEAHREEVRQEVRQEVRRRAAGAEVAIVDAEVIDAEVVDDDDLVQLAATANRHYADFESAGHHALVAAWNCGAALARAKALVGHGEFKPWVEANFDGSYSLASSYMRIAANVQRSELSEHDSINGVLKAIAAGKDRPAKPERTLETRARNIRQAADKLAAVVTELAADIDTDSGAAIEADLNWAADVVAQAFQRIDNVIYGRDR